MRFAARPSGGRRAATYIPKSPSPHLLKGVPDAPFRWLRGVSASEEVTSVHSAFETFAAHRTGDWRRLWSEFESRWKRKSMPATDKVITRAACAALRNLKP